MPPTAICSFLPLLDARPIWTQGRSRPKKNTSAPKTWRPQAQVSSPPWPHSAKELQDVEGSINHSQGQAACYHIEFGLVPGTQSHVENIF